MRSATDSRACSPDALSAVLQALRTVPAGTPPAEIWSLFSRRDWTALFRLLDLAADLPRLADNRALAAWTASPAVDGWPELGAVWEDLVRLQELVDRPVVPSGSRRARVFAAAELEAAHEELEASHCVHVDFLLAPAERPRLEREIASLLPEKRGSWGELERAAAPKIYEIFESALGSERFSTLTGFDLERDEYTLTLSLQELDASGIGWHRDLYWPKEWVGEDVFAVLYALDGESSEGEDKGGAFVHWVPWQEKIEHHYRQLHEATLLWNSADPAGRLLHAVSGYHGIDTARHLVILQCHRKAGASLL